MSGPEIDWDAILVEVQGVLSKKDLQPPAISSDSGVYHPSERQAREAAKVFERNIQREFVLVFLEWNEFILSKFPIRERIDLYKNRFSSFIGDQVAILRIKNKNLEADVLEKTDNAAVLEIIQQESREGIKKLARQTPGTDEYHRNDSRIWFLDRWEKLCDGLGNLEQGEETL